MSSTPQNSNLPIIFGLTLMVVMGVSSIMPVLPLLARELQAPVETIGLVLTGFTLPGIFLAPVAGILADRYGRKKVLIPSLIIFGLAGAACGLAQTLSDLLILRFIQGIGAAPLGVLYTTIIGDLYKGKERTRIMGLNAGVLGMGTAIFPALGGLLGELGWHWPFFLPLVALPLCYAVLKHLNLPEPESKQDLKSYFKSAKEIVQSKQAVALFAVTLLTFFILYGPIVTFFPVLADTSFDVPPSAIGGLFGASSLATALASALIGKLSRWFSERTMLCVGHVLYIISMILIPLTPHYWWMFIPICTFGLAQGFNFPNLTTLLTSLAPIEQRAAVMAVNGTVLRLAQTISPMFFTLVFWIGDLSAVYYAGAALSAFMLYITLARVSSTLHH
ncbi:MFS transporter [Desulfovibrio mangrovi]|uniref:MFS transporter n=1 Tax=Desulfovibrio mangrovi TaxID=2976983 RepID=UPI0022474647|nr:MFS transporter [Desulfovibrio mangrovi]UZP68068.1 MFS transporter [Desulfovibrio mangrovi]